MKELICIFLHVHFDGFAFPVFEGKAEIGRVVKLSFCTFKEAKHLLELSKHVIIYHFLLIFLHVFRSVVLRLEEGVPELGNHVELLEH